MELKIKEKLIKDQWEEMKWWKLNGSKIGWRTLFIRHKSYYSHIIGKNGILGTKVGFEDSKWNLTLWTYINECLWLVGSAKMQKRI